MCVVCVSVSVYMMYVCNEFIRLRKMEESAESRMGTVWGMAENSEMKETGRWEHERLQVLFAWKVITNPLACMINM